MFQKKPIYIVGTLLFTLLLLADLAIFFLVPIGGRGNMPGINSGAFGGELPESFDFGSFGNAEGEPPEGFGGQMAEGEDFTMPEGVGGQMAEGEDFTMPEGFDSANLPNQGQTGFSAGSGILSTIRSFFWPILIVCVLGDALCIFMLLRISRKNGNKYDSDMEEDDSDNPPRRDRTNTWLAVIAIVLVGAVTLTSLPNGSSGGTMEAQTTIEQAEASLQDIVSSFSGSGTLASANEQTQEIPVSVTVTSYAVKNGDVVNAGDVIARVDKTSVQKALYEVQSLIAEMDGEIAEIQGDTLDSKITARADGRVKAIYAAEGDSVAQTMYDNGAVMLISLGGSMTVVIESRKDVVVGQTLTVTLSDGSQIEGKVQQVRDGKITVTTTDDGPAPDDKVIVTTEEGTRLGTGTLSVSSPLKVTGYFGTVDKIRVDVGDKVKTGDTLLTLKNTEDVARYQQLLQERTELTELVRELSAMYQDGTIRASTAGIVSQIEEDAVYSQLSVVSEDGSSASGRTASSASGSYGIVRLSTVTTEPSEPPTQDTLPPEASAPTEGVPPTEEITPPADGVMPPTDGTTLPGGTTPPSGDLHADGTFAGKVTKVSYGELRIKISQTDMTGSTIAAVETMNEELFTTEKQYTPSLSFPVNQYQNGQTIPSSVDAIQAGDKVLIQIQDGTVTRIDFIAGTGMSGPSQSTTPGGGMQQMPSGGGSFGASSSTQKEDEEEAVYTVEKTSLCAIIPAEVMTVDISVDELDILALAVGQEGTITLDALPGQSFTGSVRKINPVGANEGGSTKYTVTMEVPRTEQMLPGMNASVRIQVSCLDAVLTVPAEAVYEDGNRTYVYTALDEKTGEPANPVDVTTGASDGKHIEILSGLSNGDAVYYSYADSIVYQFAG